MRLIGNYINLILHSIIVVDLAIFQEQLELLPNFGQLLGRGEVEEVIGCFEADKNITNDRNWMRKRLRYCVMLIDDVKVLYYREQEVRGILRPRLRVVPKEDLWDTLVNAHTHLCHGGRDRMQAYFLEHMYHIPREVTVLFLRLCPIC